MRRVLLGLVLLSSCRSSAPELSPTTVSQQGGEQLRISTGADLGDGGVVVLVDGVPAHAVVVEAPGLVRARLPSLPRAGEVDVEVLGEDGTVVSIAGLMVTAPELDVRASVLSP